MRSRSESTRCWPRHPEPPEPRVRVVGGSGGGRRRICCEGSRLEWREDFSRVGAKRFDEHDCFPSRLRASPGCGRACAAIVTSSAAALPTSRPRRPSSNDALEESTAYEQERVFEAPTAIPRNRSFAVLHRSHPTRPPPRFRRLQDDAYPGWTMMRRTIQRPSGWRCHSVMIRPLYSAVAFPVGVTF
jgi:hypothetical protein